MPTIYRYRDGILSTGGLGTAKAVTRIRRAVRAGQLSTVDYILKEGERLDQIAGRRYGDPRLWWIIAAASNVGWWMQLPAGIQLTIPTDITQVDGII